MNIDTSFLRHCIGTLERAVGWIGEQERTNDFAYDIYCAACVKEFELVLEQSGKLLRKRIAAYFASNLRPIASHSGICSAMPLNTG